MVTKSMPTQQGLATKNDLLQASKAIYDQTRSMVDNKFDESEMSLILKIQGVLSKNIEEMFRQELDRRLSEFCTVIEDKINSINLSYQDGLLQIKMFLQALPTPQINVNVPQQETPQVNVNIP